MWASSGVIDRLQCLQVGPDVRDGDHLSVNETTGFLSVIRDWIARLIWCHSSFSGPKEAILPMSVYLVLTQALWLVQAPARQGIGARLLPGLVSSI